MMTEWWRTAVFYEIYVRSFQDSNGDGVGDLNGITTRLNYLNDGTPKSLGVDALSLSAHKLGGPMGVGAFVLNGAQLDDKMLRGGGQDARIEGSEVAHALR